MSRDGGALRVEAGGAWERGALGRWDGGVRELVVSGAQGTAGSREPSTGYSAARGAGMVRQWDSVARGWQDGGEPGPRDEGTAAMARRGDGVRHEGQCCKGTAGTAGRGGRYGKGRFEAETQRKCRCLYFIGEEGSGGRPGRRGRSGLAVGFFASALALGRKGEGEEECFGRELRYDDFWEIRRTKDGDIVTSNDTEDNTKRKSELDCRFLLGKMG